MKKKTARVSRKQSQSQFPYIVVLFFTFFVLALILVFVPAVKRQQNLASDAAYVNSPRAFIEHDMVSSYVVRKGKTISISAIAFADGSTTPLPHPIDCRGCVKFYYNPAVNTPITCTDETFGALAVYGVKGRWKEIKGNFRKTGPNQYTVDWNTTGIVKSLGFGKNANKYIVAVNVNSPSGKKCTGNPAYKNYPACRTGFDAYCGRPGNAFAIVTVNP